MQLFAQKVDIYHFLDETSAEELWRVIANNGLSAKDFRVAQSDLPGYRWKLSHRPTGQTLYVSHSFGVNDPTYRRPPTMHRTWTPDDRAELLLTQPGRDPRIFGNVDASGLVDTVQDWANKLKVADSRERQYSEESPPGRFADNQADDYARFPHEGQVGDNAPFTAAERSEIIGQIRAIRVSVRQTFDLSSEQFAAVDERLNEAEEASRRLGRKDWKTIFYGSVLSLILNDAIPPEVAGHIFSGVLHGVMHFLGGGAPPAPWPLSSR